MAGLTPVLLFRDSTAVQGFDRHVEEDLSPRFSPWSDTKHPDVSLIDSDTETKWSSEGVAVDGPKETHGKKLTPVLADDELYWGVMKFWYPNLQWVDSAALKAAGQTAPEARSPMKQVPAKKRKSKRAAN
jgi:hypothetical protein